jgi:tRNA nucleotidyltransferase (CCA-adding enzyme)
MENRIKKIEEELNEIKIFFNQFKENINAEIKEKEALSIFSKTVGNFMTESAKRIVENENYTIDLFKQFDQKIEVINSNILRLTNLTTAIIETEETNTNTLLELIKTKL